MQGEISLFNRDSLINDEKLLTIAIFVHLQGFHPISKKKRHLLSSENLR